MWVWWMVSLFTCFSTDEPSLYQILKKFIRSCSDVCCFLQVPIKSGIIDPDTRVFDHGRDAIHGRVRSKHTYLTFHLHSLAMELLTSHTNYNCKSSGEYTNYEIMLYYMATEMTHGHCILRLFDYVVVLQYKDLWILGRILWARRQSGWRWLWRICCQDLVLSACCVVQVLFMFSLNDPYVHEAKIRVRNFLIACPTSADEMLLIG